MDSSQLLLVLRSLQKTELAQFEKFLHSPYFHRKKLPEELFPLWIYIKKGLKSKGQSYFEKSKVYQILFPQQPFFKGKLEKLMSQLYAQVKSFLVFQQLEQNAGEQMQQIHLMTAFFDRKLSRPFNHIYKKLQAIQPELEDNWSADFLYEQFVMQEKISEFQSLYNTRKNDLNLPQTHFYLDLHFLVSKLKYAIQLLARDLFVFKVNSEESLLSLDAIIPVLSSAYKDIPMVKLYLKAYALLKCFYIKEGENLHQQFNQLLDTYAASMPYEQLKTLQTLNRNYAVYKYHEGNPIYLKQTFILYQQHLKQGFLYQNDQILPGTLSNIVLIGLRNKAFDWVYQFLLQHKDCIGGTTTPDIVFQYNMGQYYFSIQDYDKSLSYIALTYEDQYYKIAARRLEVMILYEINSEIFESKLNAFKLYIYRLTEASAHFKNKIRNQNFADLLKQIWRPKTLKNQTRIDKLLKKAKSLKYLTDREWLIEKLNSLR